jgi:2'-5' RNA ligase
MRELEVVRDFLARLPAAHTLVVGDFNQQAEDPDPEAVLHGYSDAWCTLRGAEAGPTFDPDNNPLAALLSRGGRAERCDRVLVGPGVEPLSINTSRGQPVDDELPVSDHAAVVAEVRLGGGAPSYRSALAVLPPRLGVEGLHAARARYDRHARRWMPHVNVMYGFVPEREFAAALPRLEEALSRVEPFDLRLEELREFGHGSSCTIWLLPATRPEGALHEIWRRLVQAYPQCDELERIGEGGFTPHLSVAQATARRRADVRSALEAALEPVTFRVEQVALMSRQGREPFEVRAWIPLGAALLAERRRSVLERLARLFADGDPGTFLPVGSTALELDDAWSDVDGLVVGSAPAEQALPRAKQRIEAEGCSWCHVVAGRISGVRAVIDGVSVDIQVGQLSADLNPSHWPSLAAADGAAEPALRPFLEIKSVERMAGARVGELRSLYKAVRRWTHARMIDSQALGYLGGHSWLLLCLWTLMESDRAASGGELQRALFQRVATWPWPRPIMLVGGQPGAWPESHPMPIPGLSAPHDDTARGVTRSTRDVILEEARRAHDLQPHERREPPTVAPDWVLTVEADSPAELAAAEGESERRFVGLLLDLERAGARARPLARWERARSRGAWFSRLGICAAGSDAAEAVFQDFGRLPALRAARWRPS